MVPRVLINGKDKKHVYKTDLPFAQPTARTSLFAQSKLQQLVSG